MKNLGNGKHSVESSMRNAYRKWTRLELDESNSRIVPSSFGAICKEDLIIVGIKKRMRYAREVLYVKKRWKRHQDNEVRPTPPIAGRAYLTSVLLYPRYLDSDYLTRIK